MSGQYIEPMLATSGSAAETRAGAPLALRLPGLCAICRGWGRGRVCADCLAVFAVRVARCERCALPIAAGVRVCGACLTAPPAFDAARAAIDYGEPWDRLVTAFKFHGALDLAGLFAAMLVHAASEAGADGIELVLPVPLAAERLRERGYNQAWELARRAARRLAIAADPHLLLRIRATAHQLALPPEARAGNVRGAFAVEPRRRAEIVGRRVAIVDDVMTTGSTAGELAQVLKQAGAAHVAVWVLARTPRPGER
jgi:ComF family protein